MAALAHRSAGFEDMIPSIAHDGPAPGSAEGRLLSNYQQAPAFSFGGRLRELSSLEVPGAGSYDHDIDASAKHARVPKFSFGAATRTEPRRPRQPGPGAYAAPSFIGKAGPSFSCTPRRAGDSGTRQPLQQKMPGPGSHTLPSCIGSVGPKHSMSPRRQDLERQDLPGPGSYEDDRGGRTARPHSSPRWGFGSSAQRPRGIPDLCDTTPGPGAYRQDSQLKGPKFSMRARTAGAKQRIAKF